MNRIVCGVTIANVMKEPSHRAELHTQFLYGDVATILETTLTQWIKVISEQHQTTGWVLKSQFQNIESEAPVIQSHILFGNRFFTHDGSALPLLSGTYLSPSEAMVADSFSEAITLSTFSFDEPNKLKVLTSYLKASYHWGGTSIYGIDCSGLSKMFYKFFDLHLPHLASAQMEFGTVLDFLSNANCGDLAFFEDDNHEVNHVGILLNNHQIIHAGETNGVVAIDYIDMEGITNRRSGVRTHRLRIIKRLLDTP